MTTALQPASTTALSKDAALARAMRAAAGFAEAATAKNTVKAYNSDARTVLAWLDAHGAQWCEEALATFLADMATGRLSAEALALEEAGDEEGLAAMRAAGTAYEEAPRAVATVERYLATMRRLEAADATLGDASRGAMVRTVMRGIRRTNTKKQARAKAFTLVDVRSYLAATSDASDASTVRNRAIVALGFACALRRSEIADAQLADLEEVEGGYTLTIQRSKTDQEGEGHTKAVPFGGPAEAVAAWLKVRGDDAGPLFGVSARTVSRAVKAAAEALGYDAAPYSGHSLRAGHATSAAAAGLEERAIMRTTGHRSTEVARRYIREGDLWRSSTAVAMFR